jgi:hypothetical protein
MILHKILLKYVWLEHDPWIANFHVSRTGVGRQPAVFPPG